MEPPSPNTTERLLDIKRGLGHDLPPRPQVDEEVESPPPVAGVSCVYCGYSQQGAPFNRCPECGLLFASQICDPTPWSGEPHNYLSWARTALAVWSWNRRIRVRTAMIPITPASHAFAYRSIVLCAPLFGLAVAAFGWRPGPSVAHGLGYALVESLLGAAASTLLMLLGRMSLRIMLRGRWRRQLTFTPASIDYATAWWPVLAVTCVLCGLGYRAAGASAIVLLSLFIVSSIAVWGTWLWGSVSESGNVPFTAVRVMALVLCVTAVGGWLGVSLSGISRSLMGKWTAVPVVARPSIICAVLVDLSGNDPQEKLILRQIARLGVRPQNRVLLKGSECTRDALEKALAATRAKLGPRDRFAFYLNCRGRSKQADPTAGLAEGIELADGRMNGYTLATLLASTPTNHNLLVIESEKGEMFLPDLKRSCTGVLVTCPDIPEYRFNSGLQDFWETLGESESDTNKDGRITVGEAFDAAFGLMQRGLVTRRQALMMNRLPVSTSQPEFHVTGSADQKDFWVPTPVPQSSTAPE